MVTVYPYHNMLVLWYFAISATPITFSYAINFNKIDSYLMQAHKTIIAACMVYSLTAASTVTLTTGYDDIDETGMYKWSCDVTWSWLLNE